MYSQFIVLFELTLPLIEKLSPSHSDCGIAAPLTDISPAAELMLP